MTVCEQNECIYNFVDLLKACAKKGDFIEGRRLHKCILNQGLLLKRSFLGSALINMYAKCGAVTEAQQMLDELPIQDVISWNALVSGFSQHGHGEDALFCYQQMLNGGISPTNVTFICILKACSSISALNNGKQVHGIIISNGFLRSDINLGNALVDMYAKCGEMGRAKQVFEGLTLSDSVSWSALIAGYAQNEHGEEALSCFEQMKKAGVSPHAVVFVSILRACGSMRAIDKGEEIHNELIGLEFLQQSVVLGNALIDMYTKCGALTKAETVLNEIPVRDVISWTTLIAGYANSGHADHALRCFKQMCIEGILPNAVTLICVLKACGTTRSLDDGQHIHTLIASMGLEKHDSLVGNALVDMYAKCGDFENAERVLNEVSLHDVTSWNALIAGYTEQRLYEEALNCFKRMKNEDVSPDCITYTCVLKACGGVGAIQNGEKLHSEILNKDLLRKDMPLSTALVDMYIKCGSIMKAEQVFDELPVQSTDSWNSLITGYSQHGQCYEALRCLKRMQKKGIIPDSITFSSILKACGSAGEVERGKEVHEMLSEQGVLGKDIVLDTALVDMYATCGELQKAEEVVDELSLQNVCSWNALISGYGQQGQGEKALKCYEKMQCNGISPDSITFIALLNACSHAGLLDDGERYFADMTSKHHIMPDLDHHTCMVDLFGRAGHFQKALAVIAKMPLCDHFPVWSTLLGACHKWGNVELGRFAFDQAIQLDSSNSAVFIIMSNIYAAAGMHGHAPKLEEP